MRDPNGITDQLALRRAGDVEDAPPTLTFDRERAVDLPWSELVDTTGASESEALEKAAETLKDYFESSWGYPPGRRTKAQVENILNHDLLVAQRSIDGDAAGLRFTQLSGEEPIPAGEGVFAVHGSGRTYRLIADQPVAIENFGTSQLYAVSWSGIRSIELVDDTLNPGAGPTEVETIDLRAPFIESRYKELIVQRDIDARITEAADDMFTNGLETNVGTPAALDELQRPLTDASRRLDRTERALRSLAKQASEMGYVLYIQPAIRAGEDASTAPAGPQIQMSADALEAASYGVLYRRVVETRTHTPTATISSYVGWLFPRRVTLTIPLAPVQTKVTVHERVDTSTEPQTERIAQLRANGHFVHVCELRPNGFVTEDGTPLELIMELCSRDEQVRLRTVVFIPTYDRRLNGDRVTTAYQVFHRPDRPASPTAFPRLSVVESLSYRTSWLHSELGELVKTINLAPGERRQVTVTRSFEQETTDTRATSSVFDLSSTESSDLSTEMERSAREEVQVRDSKSASATASASGSFGWGSASASASGSVSRDQSLSNVGTSMAKSAQRAARSLNDQRRESVESSSTSRTTVSNSDTSVSEIVNINTGRTLNLMFHRLYNRYVGKLFLESLQLQVRSGFELISGSGIHQTHTYSVHELAEVVEALAQTPIPIDLTQSQQDELRLRILLEIAELIGTEYTALQPSVDAAASTIEPVRMSTGSNGDPANAVDTPSGPKRIVTVDDGFDTIVDQLRKLAPLSVGVAPSKKGADDDVSARYTTLLDELSASLATLDVHRVPVNRTEILVASPGLYLDAHVGANPSTEPYAEEMRDTEVARREAEIARIQSEATRNNAIATYMAASELGGDSGTIVDVRLEGRTLVMVLSREPGPGDWSVEWDGEPVVGEAIVTPNSIIATVVFASAKATPEWARDGDTELLRLFDKPSGRQLQTTNVLAVQ